jgi:predicted ATPase
MVQTMLGVHTVDEPLLRLLVDRSEGNPLYVEEIVRQLVETDAVLIVDSETIDAEARLATTELKVPPTIHDIIAARVDRLEDTRKRTLQAAAVIGRRFGVSLLSHVIDVPAPDVAAQLDALCALDFVFPSADLPEPMYSFKHAVTQDVVYGSLLDRRRRALHAAAGVGLEVLYAEREHDVVELLAHHFAFSADADKAVDYAIQAGEKAQRRWANAEALAHFESARTRLDTMRPDSEANRLRRIDAVVKQAEVMFALGRHAEHVAALESTASSAALRKSRSTTADGRRRSPSPAASTTCARTPSRASRTC